MPRKPFVIFIPHPNPRHLSSGLGFGKFFPSREYLFIFQLGFSYGLLCNKLPLNLVAYKEKKKDTEMNQQKN
jgi:hypothetical protein